MRYRSAPTNSGRCCDASKHLEGLQNSPLLTSIYIRTITGQHLRLSLPPRTHIVARISAAHTLVYPTTSPEPTDLQTPSAITTSQLAEELQHYAAAATAAGCRPGNTDAFLSSRLCELFSQPHRLRRLQPRQLAGLLLSLATLGANPGEDCLCDIDAACYGHPGPFDPASTTAVLQGMAALHIGCPAQQAASTAPPEPSNAAHIPEPHPIYSAASVSQAPTSASTSTSTSARGNGLTTGVSYTDARRQISPQQVPSWRSTALRNQNQSRWQSSAVMKPAAAATASARTPHIESTFKGPSSHSVADSAATTAAVVKPSCPGTQPSPAATSAPPAPYRFPHAALLRLLQGGMSTYSYEQLAVLLQAFRSLGVALDDDVVLLVGRRMADLLADMGPEQQLAVLSGVLRHLF